MNRALRYPSRWAGRWRTLIITAALTGLGACTSMDNVLYGAREGTMEYPGSGAGPRSFEGKKFPTIHWKGVKTTIYHPDNTGRSSQIEWERAGT